MASRFRLCIFGDVCLRADGLELRGESGSTSIRHIYEKLHVRSRAEAVAQLYSVENNN